ncbi:hypothetical protein ACSX1A_10300 [Pontibacter sp. MBLB2868]|uniref:hypothetical protein n=1 Tax=Pontibacter sp. MBLB2868 TaxID=3451555 RepID=UPI003F75531B
MPFTTANRLKYTKALVLISIAGTFATVITGALGWGEVYPFATWKLYTQPLGSKHTFTEFRIYTLAKGEQHWKRQPVITNSPNFTPDEYVYTLNKLISASTSDSPDTTLFKSKLEIFVKYIAPAAEHYKIVRETYSPLELLQNPQHYDTLTVISF